EAAEESASEEVLEESSEEVMQEEAAEEAVSEEISEEAAEEAILEEAAEETASETEAPAVLGAQITSEEENTSSSLVVYDDGYWEDTETGDWGYCFEEDGSFTIQINEADPYFPYEVQFTVDGVTTTEWFMDQDDTVTVGGHVFAVSAIFTGTQVTRMTLDVAGTEVVVYPEEKEFVDDPYGTSTLSLLNLTEKRFSVDLSGFTPVELTMVSVGTVFAGTDYVSDTDCISWAYSWGDDYSVTDSSGTMNLNYYSSWQMIVGEADQLASGNTRYIVNTNVSTSTSWLTPTVYLQDSAGTRTEQDVARYSYYGYNPEEYIVLSNVDRTSDIGVYVTLNVNSEVYSSVNYAELRAYEGEYETAAEAVANGTDITSQILGADMSVADAGYLYTSSGYITLVSFDSSGNATGCLPVDLYISFTSNYVSGFSMYKDDVRVSRTYTMSYSGSSDLYTIKAELYSEYDADSEYGINLYYYEAGTSNNDAVTAAYVGQYDSIAAATAAGAENIKASLFDSSVKYYDNFSQGVYLSIFVGEDGTEDQETYFYYVTAETGDVSVGASPLSSGTLLTINSFVTEDGSTISTYSCCDSYGENNYYMVLVGSDVDVTNLAMNFYVSSKAKLYAAGSSTEEVSGESFHDYTDMVQFTVSAEDGTSSKNVWVQVIKATEGTGQLVINSFADADAETTVTDGVIYSTREMMLDSYHSNVHDILIANMGTEEIESLSVELISDVVELDEYWTLTGNYPLSGYTGIQNEDSEGNYVSYGEMDNLAMLRLTTKDGVAAGTDVSGTLTIKSGDTTLAVLTLTGTTSDPAIVTDDIPDAVLYVPYGSMIQNSNKYSWNTVSYTLTSGSLPAGMELKSNGEIYGVPTETGTFTFGVRMQNSYSSFSSVYKTFTLTVLDNTDENVENATDTNYELSQRVTDVGLNSDSDQTVVSEGIYGEFKYVYIDGVKLTEGEDYTSESGSTRITIRSETLKQSNTVGTHTIGIEFRTGETDDDEGTLMRAAQNYNVVEETSDTDSSDSTDTSSSDTSSSDTSSSDTSSSDASSGDNANISSNDTGSTSTPSYSTEEDTVTEEESEVTTEDIIETLTYTVVSGDTLWSIAARYYGDGTLWTRLYEDNMDVISDPNRIYAGMQLTIYVTVSTTSFESNTYTVKSGDSLWKIAAEIYGNGRSWRRIYNANTDIISDPNSIRIGMTLVIPEI
ncbi:MAG: LysM peptidoglycan-binding domain-containing protein, partial [Lachnospiraceae bacterium]|nr:LysM peptidoglycan-binding domain-containing protein [Lachnospiraceae bacterium]